MDLYRSLYEMSKMLLAQIDAERTAEVLLAHLLEAAGAERGFVVVRSERGSFEQKFEVHYGQNWISEAERRFSRSLVRQAIESHESIHVQDIQNDPRLRGVESIERLGRSSVLVVPLLHEAQVYGALYLERPAGGGFPPEVRDLAAEFAEMAGLCLRTALEKQALRERTRSLERDLRSRYQFPGIVTAHPRMLELLRVVGQVADSQASVLLHGESGTGKELIAQALHLNSGRASRPFVALHAAALPASVLESELFGHLRGAFTGATKDRPGRLASAEGGTLFLDEIAEISPELQVKLLRFLQCGEIQRVGSDRAETVDVRILAATNADLGASVQAGKFRQDLYYRLRVLELRIPPLRERTSDLPLLVDHFLKKHWRRRRETPRLAPAAEAALRGHAWPGNVRELDHAIERMCLLATGPELGTELLPEEMRPPPGAAPRVFGDLTNAGLKASRERAAGLAERDFVAALMERHEGNLSKAARAAGMQRRHLQRLLARTASSAE